MAALDDRLALPRLVFDTSESSTKGLRKSKAFRSLADLTNERLEFDMDPPHARFRRRWLASRDTHFVLVGVVNRLDRRDVMPGTCGETRLVYRLAADDERGPRRLPLSYNVIFAQPDDGDDCRRIARSWMVGRPTSLTDPGGPLHADRLALRNLRFVEFNLRAVEFAPNEFSANAMGVLRYDADAGIFEPERMEFEPVPWKGRLDRPRRRAEVLTPSIVTAALDGVGLLATEDRARRIGFTPEGVPGVRALDSWVEPPFSSLVPAQLATSIARPSDPDYASPAASLHRLDGNSCTGCHRQRAIEGFHLPGQGGAHGLLEGVSPHLAAQQQWRRDYVSSVAEGRSPPQRRPLHNAGSGAIGDHCSVKGSPVDSLRCQPELQCVSATGFAFGVCLESRHAIGSPCSRADETCAQPSRWFPGGHPLDACTDETACAPVIRPVDFRRCRGNDDRWSCAADRAASFAVARCSATRGCRDGYVCVGSGEQGTCTPTASLAEFRLFGQ